MSLVTAALRPSGASYRDALMKKEIHKNISPIIDELLKDNYGFLVYQCIPESEYINTISGRKYIKDCIEGELIYTKTGVHKINKVIPKKNNNILAIKTKHSNVRCTLDHKVLTHRGWVEAKDLTLNDSLAYRIGGNISQKSYDKNWLKVIGWYLGDGWVTHKPKIVYMINKDLDVINDFSKCIENINNNLTTTIYSPPLIKGRKTLIYRASVRWKKQKPITNEIFKQLESWGVDKEAANKKIPDFIFELKNESLKYFLGAYTDTDSCLNNGSKITCFYKTVSKELAEGLREIIRLLGYSTQVQMCDTGSGTTAYGLYVDNATSFLRDLYNYSIKVRKKYTLNELSSKRDMSGGLVNAKYVENILIQNNISPRMVQRRFGISVRYKDYVRKSTIIKLNDIYDCFSEDLIRDDIVWSPILDIKNDGKEMTYDLSIDKDHTFLVNGLVVHNCDVISFLQQICGLSGSEADNIRRCVDENTLITMADGSKKCIKDIKIGDMVLSFNQYGVCEPKEVSQVFDNGFQDTIEISTIHSNNLICTPTHKILTQDGYKCGEQLNNTDVIMTPKYIRCITDNLSPNKHLSHNMLFLLGMLIGDGTLKNGDIRFTNCDTELINAYQKFILEKHRHRYNNDIFQIQSYQQKDYYKECFRVRIINSNVQKSLCSWLQKYNLLCKSNQKAIPNEIMHYPVGNKIYGLLGGLFSTDGSCYKTYIQYATMSKTLANQVSQLLLKCNIYNYIHIKKGASLYNQQYHEKCYVVRISTIDGLKQFEKNILPHIIGNHKELFANIITNAKSHDNYNYLAPNKCRLEILNNSMLYQISINSLYDKHGKVSSHENYITDTKLAYLSQHIYTPYTYWLLHSDYLPLQVKNIHKVGIKHVYDIEVKDNYNYVANNLVVHNCIARKKIDQLEVAMPRIIDGYCSKSDQPRDVAEKEVQQYIQIIEDASSYMFGKNHSIAYCMIGYLCAYLRYYHTPYFITAYLNNAANEDDIIGGFEMAKLYGYQILPPRFRYSTDKYMYDEENNNIYKGVASIKYLNSGAAEYLYSLRYNKYNNFIELLIQIEKDRQINSHQMEILIKLQYFDEFGKNKKLLEIYQYFKTLYGRKTISKDKMEDIHVTLEDIGQCFEKETEKQFTNIDYVAILSNIEKHIPNEYIPLTEQILFEIDIVGYISSIYDVDKRYCLVTDVNTKYSPKVKLYSLGIGKEIECKINKNLFKSEPFKKGQIIKCGRFFEKNRQRKTETGWEETSEKDWWLSNYELINNLEL